MARQVILSSRSTVGRDDLKAWTDRVTAAIEQGEQVRDLETPEVRSEHFCDYFVIYCNADDDGIRS